MEHFNILPNTTSFNLVLRAIYIMMGKGDIH